MSFHHYRNPWADSDFDYDDGFDRHAYPVRHLDEVVDPAILEPLLNQMREYDRLRLRLEKRGGGLPQLEQIADVLNAKFSLELRYYPVSTSLSDQKAVRSALSDLRGMDINLDVRVSKHGMPLYYVCRINRDYWAEYSLVVEDIYQSPGYEIKDERFVKLMSRGHESYFLRLSHLRERAKEVVQNKGSSLDEDVDELLYTQGRHIFQAAWHEDQQAGIVVANHLKLNRFKEAIELLYLALSGELCEIRNFLNEQMTQFYQRVYPQPAILDFLKSLPGKEGSELSDIPEKALLLYANMTRSFSRFLATEVEWGNGLNTIPVYKVLFGNFNRLEKVCPVLKRDPEIKTAARKLERTAGKIIGQLAVSSKQ